MFLIACFTYFLSLSVLVSCSHHSAIPIMGQFSSNDRQSLRLFFDLHTPDSAKDHTKLYHILMGLYSIGENIKEKTKFCSTFLAPITTTDFALHHSYGLTRLGLLDCKHSGFTSTPIVISACHTRNALSPMFLIACFTYFLSLSVLISCSPHSAIPIMGQFSSNDRQSLRLFFDLHAPESAKDHTKLYHILMGLSSIGENIKEKNKFCSTLLAPITTTDFALHHSYGLTRLDLPDCKVTVRFA
ncbi:unnamed protein product [Dicrocoelium dendriticum]|nr:unnamed protein product [Dicrocoelium dendriticum]